MRAWAALLLIIAALSGCTDPASPVDDDSDPGPGDGGTNGPPSGTGQDGGNGTAPGGGQDGNGTDGVPSLRLTADVLNGTAPLQVNFTIAIDDDSENVEWTLFVDGNTTENGTGAESTVQVTFGAGAWNVTVVASDGEHDVSSSLLVTAVDAQEPAGPVQTEQVSWLTSAPGCAAEYPVAAQGTPMDGVGWDTFAVDAATLERPFRMEATLGSDALGVDIAFYNADGEHVDGFLVLGSGTVVVEGTVPAGADFALVSSCGATGGQATYQA